MSPALAGGFFTTDTAWGAPYRLLASKSPEASRISLARVSLHLLAETFAFQGLWSPA